MRRKATRWRPQKGTGAPSRRTGRRSHRPSRTPTRRPTQITSDNSHIRVEPDAGSEPTKPHDRRALTDTGRMVDDETSIAPGDELVGSRINPHMIGDAGIGSHLGRRTEPDPGAYPGARTNERAFLYMRICPDNRLGTQLRSRVEDRIGSHAGTGSQPCALTHGNTRAYACARTHDGIRRQEGAGPNRSSRLDARGRSDIRRRMNPSTIPTSTESARTAPSGT